MIQINNLDTIIGMSAYACEVLEAIHNDNPDHYTFILDDKWELNTTGVNYPKGKVIVKMVEHKTYNDAITLHVVGWQQASETLTNKTLNSTDLLRNVTFQDPTTTTKQMQEDYDKFLETEEANQKKVEEAQTTYTLNPEPAQREYLQNILCDN